MLISALNWPKCGGPPPGGLRVSTIFGTSQSVSYFTVTSRKRKLRPPQDTYMAEGAERFRGLWEDEMFAVVRGDPAEQG